LDDLHLELMARLQDIERDKTMQLAEHQSKLASDAAERTSKLASDAADRTSKRLTLMIRDISTAGAFAVSLILFGYLLVTSSNPWPATFMFACVIASACAFFYGKFITPKIPANPIAR
jgi:sulfite reductase beta subunit-like hemoprotein